MRILTVLALTLAGGCAARRAAVTAKPTSDELPDLTAAEGTFPVDVGVSGAGDRPRVLIVARLPAPELTPEERAKLGQDPELDYDPLEFYRSSDGAARGVDPRSTGLQVGTGGWGGVSAGRQAAFRVWGLGGGLAGVTTGQTIRARRVSTAGPNSPPPQGLGPRSRVRVGYRGPACWIARAYPARRR